MTFRAYAAWSWSQRVDPRWRPGPEHREPFAVSRRPRHGWRATLNVLGLVGFGLWLEVFLEIAR